MGGGEGGGGLQVLYKNKLKYEFFNDKKVYKMEGLEQFSDLRGDLAKRGCNIFEGGLIPQCTLWLILR